MNHVPVLLNEVIKILNLKPGDFFIDGTVGEGGHAKEIIKKVEPGGMFLGVDWDEEQAEKARKNLIPNSKFQIPKKVVIVQGNYREIPDIQKKRDFPKADGLLLDLGFSSAHLESGRGFTFQKDEPLNMRYSDIGGTAADIVNALSEEKLADIFWQYGEEKASRKIAKAIVEARRKQNIKTTKQLAEIVENANNIWVYETHNIKKKGRGKVHPATKVFQALRIYVNDELGNLKSVLGNIGKIMRPGGRVAIISFHSLEDRIVKQAFKKLEEEGYARRINKKTIKPSREEIQKNPRSRSAKLRAIQII